MKLTLEITDKPTEKSFPIVGGLFCEVITIEAQLQETEKFLEAITALKKVLVLKP